MHTVQVQKAAIESDRRRNFKATTQDTKKGKLEDRRVSVCSLCKRGIFNNHIYIWTSIGLVHVSCKDEDEDKKST
jgi:hypothetical protein